MNSKFILLLVVAGLLAACTKKSPLESWKAGSANNDVFLEMTDQHMQELKKNNLTYLEVDWWGVAPEQIEEWGKGVKERADKAGITIWSAHIEFGGVYDISQPDEATRQKAVEANLKDMEIICRTLKPQNLVVHASLEPIADSVRPAYLAAAKKSIQELAAKAKEYNVTLLVENLPRTCLGNTSTELLDIINGIDNTAICFDVNHLLKEEHTEFVRNAGSKIKSTHMSDYDRKNERHWLPKTHDSVINWPELLHALVEAGYQGPFIYEVGVKKDTITINDLKMTWDNLKKEYADAYMK